MALVPALNCTGELVLGGQEDLLCTVYHLVDAIWFIGIMVAGLIVLQMLLLYIKTIQLITSAGRYEQLFSDKVCVGLCILVLIIYTRSLWWVTIWLNSKLQAVKDLSPLGRDGPLG